MVACQRLGQICRRKTGADVKKIVTVEAYRFGTFGQQRNGEVHQGYRAQIRGRTSYGALVRAVLWNADALAIDAEFRRLTPEGVTPADMRFVVEMDGEERSRMRRVDGREFSERTFNVSQGRFVVLTGPAQELHRARAEAAAVHSRATRLASAGDFEGAFRELNAYVADFSRVGTHDDEFHDSLDAPAASAARSTPVSGTAAPPDVTEPTGDREDAAAPAAGEPDAVPAAGAVPAGKETAVAEAAAGTEVAEARVPVTAGGPEAAPEDDGATEVTEVADVAAVLFADGQPAAPAPDSGTVSDVSGAIPAPAVAVSGRGTPGWAPAVRTATAPAVRPAFGFANRTHVPVQRPQNLPVGQPPSQPARPSRLPSETPEAAAIRELGLAPGSRVPPRAHAAAPDAAQPPTAIRPPASAAGGIPSQLVRRASGFVTAGPVPAARPAARPVQVAPPRPGMAPARTGATAAAQPRAASGPAFRR
jgi:hypothetical protein